MCVKLNLKLYVKSHQYGSDGPVEVSEIREGTLAEKNEQKLFHLRRLLRSDAVVLIKDSQ